MRSVAEHLTACLEIAQAADPLDVPLPDAVGCVLAEDVVAAADMPELDLAGQDGYAVCAADVAQLGAGRYLEVQDAVRAGDVRPVTLVKNAAVLIDSGAPLPRGADAVVPWQDTDRGTSQVRIDQVPTAGQNLRPRAGELASGQTVLKCGARLSARQVGLLAAMGLARVRVHPAPRVVVISIGDELVEPGTRRPLGDVYDANGHALASAVRDAGGRAFRVAPVPDDVRALTECIEDQLVRADVIITSGGLSVGQSDTVKSVLAPLGTVRFDQVQMSPGRQLGLGTVGDGTPIFCLPGEPAAALIAYEAFVRPVLRQMAGWAGLHRSSVPAVVSQGWESPRGLRQFLPVRVAGSPTAGYQAEPMGTGLLALARANALAVVPEEGAVVTAGTTLACLLLDS
ncbi:Molybdopterin molybdenumtransferase [Actinomyces bovis]|uniref:Molybdopterin molybdenumtransferase n=1 Tax=Actinomyces bovis TaxID=1658 RepID=A0ABY1VQ25_9ACTO|nr:gephyrin-like molybdotransferase Glp [Actinomyces bovis]SPT54226.1 Molybdopterin molybdenumtransferase [Actinomyces bovis]VEG56502.1 Molybdopterin molybdenumtransferase [Actinomyces israelii]